MTAGAVQASVFRAKAASALQVFTQRLARPVETDGKSARGKAELLRDLGLALLFQIDTLD